MISIVQRVTHARVEVAGNIVGQIDHGLLVLASVERDDTDEDIAWTANKLAGLRIFRNGEKHFDLDVRQIGGGILLVSNFTVAAETQFGRRPSFDRAAGGDEALTKFNKLVDAVTSLGVPVATGSFGADMKVTLTNDGPATFIVSRKPSQGE